MVLWATECDESQRDPVAQTLSLPPPDSSGGLVSVAIG
jgi:hypothetical protein